MNKIRKLLAALLAASLLLVFPASIAEQTAPIVVTDGIGREFTFEAPIATAVVYDCYNTEVFRAVGAYDAMVGVL